MLRDRLFLSAVLLCCCCLVQRATWADEGRLYVYKDYLDKSNKATCCSVMPARAADKNMVVRYPPKEAGTDGTGKSIKLTFRVSEPPKWAGVVFPVIEDYWGEWDAKALNLSTATKLVFQARGELGGERIQVKAAIAGDKPYGDSALIPITTEWFALARDWTKYEIPVDGTQLKRVITPFSIVVNDAYNPSGTATVYLDDIYYEVTDGTKD